MTDQKVVIVRRELREVEVHICPFCGSDCKFIDDTHGPMSSGWTFWECLNTKACQWSEIYPHSKLEKK